MRLLQKLSTPVRLGWHGLAIAATGATSLYFSENDIGIFLGGFSLGMGTSFYGYSMDSYLSIMESIKKHNNLDRRIVERHLPDYCYRQGARTAAVNYGFGKEFYDVLLNYDGKIKLKFIPNI